VVGELGRIEGKTRNALGGVSDLMREVKELQENPPPPPPEEFPPGSFFLYPKCDFDSEGNPLPPYEAPWPQSSSGIELLSLKLDALADLLQGHKDQRQPVCGQPKPKGQPVTVHFEEI
jgi:hypothetical protein